MPKKYRVLSIDSIKKCTNIWTYVQNYRHINLQKTETLLME